MSSCSLVIPALYHPLHIAVNRKATAHDPEKARKKHFSSKKAY
jgi:hypothetical protein